MTLKKLPIPESKPQQANPDAVRLLTAARALLWDGRRDNCAALGWKAHRYICHAIAAAGRSQPASEDLVDWLIEHIGDCLSMPWSDTSSYEGWLGTLPNPPDYNYQGLQAGRLLWIDQLIQDFGGTNPETETGFSAQAARLWKRL